MFFLIRRRTMEKRPEPNLDTVVEFYGAHPGYGGAAALFPRNLKAIADDLSGKCLTLKEAKERFVSVLRECDAEVKVGEAAILISIPSLAYAMKHSCTLHCWRAISFRHIA
jgi:hypothetical protein